MDFVRTQFIIFWVLEHYKIGSKKLKKRRTSFLEVPLQYANAVQLHTYYICTEIRTPEYLYSVSFDDFFCHHIFTSFSLRTNIGSDGDDPISSSHKLKLDTFTTL